MDVNINEIISELKKVLEDNMMRYPFGFPFYDAFNNIRNNIIYFGSNLYGRDIQEYIKFDIKKINNIDIDIKPKNLFTLLLLKGIKRD